MKIGLIGKKIGMTRIFVDDGQSIPVTVVKADDNAISQVKTIEHDGYQAVQVCAGTKKSSQLTKPMAGHFAKAGVPSAYKLTEFPVNDAEIDSVNLGDQLTVEQFSAGESVHVTGMSKGKGFAGTIKRHNFKGQDRSHGNSLSHRVPGSIGQNQTPGRVFKGKKMAGQLGNVKVTTKNLEIVRIDAEQGLLMIKGAVPGATGGYVMIKPAATK